MTLQDYLQTEGNLIPMFVELCVKHLEGQGKARNSNSSSAVSFVYAFYVWPTTIVFLEQQFGIFS